MEKFEFLTKIFFLTPNYFLNKVNFFFSIFLVDEISFCQNFENSKFSIREFLKFIIFNCKVDFYFFVPIILFEKFPIKFPIQFDKVEIKKKLK